MDPTEEEEPDYANPGSYVTLTEPGYANLAEPGYANLAEPGYANLAEPSYVNLAAIALEETADEEPPDYHGDQRGSQEDWSHDFTYPPDLPEVGASQVSTQSDNIHEVSTQL